MKIIERHGEDSNYPGRPRVVELTGEEELIAELYNLQLDQGLGCQEAMVRLRGADVPPGLRTPTPHLDSVLTPEFVDWLVC